LKKHIDDLELSHRTTKAKAKQESFLI